ncbi:MAG: alpha/beta hydrolase [Candidatus Hydrogenedentes bacterium]|nr:alpha/beta hydrolase [Candidatus Hydrogenedentota bacterium]
MPTQKLTFLAKQFHHRVPFSYHPCEEAKGTIGFIHGFSVPPSYYQSFLQRLAKSFTVVAPEVPGINRYFPQPTSIDEYTDMCLDFFEELHYSDCKGYEVIKGFEPEYLVGHSLGGAIAVAMAEMLKVKAVVAINPVMPVTYGPIEIVRRGLGVGVDAMGKKRTGFHPTMIPGYFANLAVGVRAVPLLLNDICRYRYAHSDGTAIKVKQPTLIVFSKKDQLFGASLTEETLRLIDRTFKDYELVHNAYQHDYPLEHPQHAAKTVLDWLEARV